MRLSILTYGGDRLLRLQERVTIGCGNALHKLNRLREGSSGMGGCPIVALRHMEDHRASNGIDFVGGRLAVEPKQGIGKLKLVSI